ncbi:MAG: hypothetical protein IPJ34_10025 [Myxococcales bacterium]|nr:hypothetical protein [Myxococcales bacterium]
MGRFGRPTARGFVARAAGIGLVAWASSAHAAPQDLFGFGARSAAMGATSAAAAEGYEAVFGNPALLADTREKSLTLGLNFARHFLHADTADRARSLPTDPMKTITIGAALPIPLGGVLRDRITFGVGFLDPVKYLVRAKILYPETHQFPIIAPRVQSLAIILGLGARIGDRLYVGGGFEALAALVGTIDIRLDATGRVGSRTDDQVVAAYAPIFAAAFDLSPKLRLGATFRGELIGRFAVLIRAQDLGIPLPDFNVAGMAQYIPRQLQLEVRWLERRTTIALGVLARQWSRYPGPNEPTVSLNQEYGTGSPPFSAHDTLSPRIGVEHVLPLGGKASLRLRGGYIFEPSPLDEQTGKDNLLDATRHVVTAGVGVLGGQSLPFSVDVYAQAHLLATRVHHKDSESGPDVTSSGSMFAVGIATGVRF